MRKWTVFMAGALGEVWYLCFNVHAWQSLTPFEFWRHAIRVGMEDVSDWKRSRCVYSAEKFTSPSYCHGGVFRD